MIYIVSVDIGTTTIRSCLFDEKCDVVDSYQESMAVEISGAEEGVLRVEMDPDELFEKFVRVVSAVVSSLSAEDSVHMSICCQRNSFICWDKSNYRHLHKIVCWNDQRSRDLCDEWNSSFTVKALNVVGSVLYFFLRQPRFMAAKMYQMISAMVANRLIVTFKNFQEMQSLYKQSRLAFGCLDTWLLSRLTDGKTTLTEASNVSSTGMFDPFINDYNHTVLRIIGFPCSILPKIVDSAEVDGLATIDKKYFGREIPIVALLADQQSALYGCGGWSESDAKISLGTGTFVDLNTGKTPHASIKGLYPLVGWRLSGESTYVAEGNDHDTAVLLKWAQNIGLFSDVSETSDIAISAGGSHGVVFVPAFGGLQTPINDPSATCGFIGLRPDTQKCHMVRAILESICFRVYQIYDTMRKEVRMKTHPRIRVCGGVGFNDFVCQTISDLIRQPIERVENGGLAAAKGAALMAGLKLGMWEESSMSNMVRIERIFNPCTDNRKLLETYQIWLKGVERCSKFY